MELVKIVEKPEIGAAQSKLLKMDNPSLTDCAGGFIDYYGYVYERGAGQKHIKFNRVDEIFFAKAAALLVKREVLETVGLFDPFMFMNYEGTDLCWRIWLSGYKVVFVPTSIVYHACGSTASRLQQHIQLYHYTKNHMTGMIKNYNMKNLLKTMPAFFFLELRLAFCFVATRKIQSGLAIIRALLYNMFHLKRIWKERQIIQKRIRKISDQKLMKLILKSHPPFPLSLIFSKLEEWPKSGFMQKARCIASK